MRQESCLLKGQSIYIDLSSLTYSMVENSSQSINFFLTVVLNSMFWVRKKKDFKSTLGLPLFIIMK